MFIIPQYEQLAIQSFDDFIEIGLLSFSDLSWAFLVW
jgi:hypothetical protein